MWGAVYSVFVNDKLDLVVEVAVPGREGEDLDIRVNEDESVSVTIPAKAAPPSLQAISVSFPITNINDKWNVHEMQATCCNGLLTLVFPPRGKAEAAPPPPAPKAPKTRPAPKIDPSILKSRFGGSI